MAQAVKAMCLHTGLYTMWPGQKAAELELAFLDEGQAGRQAGSSLREAS